MLGGGEGEYGGSAVFLGCLDMLKLQIWISEGGGFVGKMGAATRGAALPAFPLLGVGWDSSSSGVGTQR